MKMACKVMQFSGQAISKADEKINEWFNDNPRIRIINTHTTAFTNLVGEATLVVSIFYEYGLFNKYIGETEIPHDNSNNYLKGDN